MKATSDKVLVAAPKGKAKKGAPKPGTVSLTVKCNQAGKVKLTGTLTQLIGSKPKHGKQKSKTYKLGPVSGTVKAGHGLTLTIKLPANDAILILICSYVGTLYGGSRTAILLNIPGTAANAASCADGYALAQLHYRL